MKYSALTSSAKWDRDRRLLRALWAGKAILELNTTCIMVDGVHYDVTVTRKGLPEIGQSLDAALRRVLRRRMSR